MRSVTLTRPFTAGLVTDQPAFAIGLQNSAFAQDGYSPSGVFKQRGGWAYDGTTADVADNLVSVTRDQYALADVTRTVTCDDDGDAFIHNPAGAGTALWAGSTPYLRRAMYRDETLWCAQDGVTPLIRYSGAGAASTSYSGTPALTSGEATVTGQTLGSAPDVGSYCAPQQTTASARLRTWHRVLESSTTSVTLENVRAAGGETLTGAGGTRFEGFGYAFPAVSVYSAGTVTFTNGTNNLDGFGTKWSTGGTAIRATSSTGADGVVITPPTGDATAYEIIAVTDDDDIQAVGGGNADVSTKSAYHITRRLPFKDVAAHKESLWGTGVAQYPNRVYVGPPAWDISVPPGYELPFSPASSWSSSNPNDYLMDFIDVPSPFDGDHNVAILTSPNPLLVLKRHAAYGISGAYGGLSVDLIADGIGCIDIRSAISVDEGQFWAGEGGVYWYTNGTIVDLTAGKINREWRALARDFDYGTLDYCSIGISQGHLIVHITTGGGVTQRTFLCDLRDQTWQSRISNFTPRAQFTSRIAAEKEKLLAVSDARQGRVLNFSPALDGSGTAKDDAGTAPVFKAWTGGGLGMANGIDGLTRFIDLDVTANVYDSSLGATVVDITTVHSGGIENELPTSKTLTPISSTTANPHYRRLSRRVSRLGRIHGIRFDQSALGTDDASTTIEIHQIVCNFRDSRGRA